jgi:DNA-binding transcriptional LysR family regulator
MDIRQVDLNLLPALDALLRHHSVTQAARELNMSQSALSTALSRLRDLLGDALFVRTGRGLLPTPRATALAPHVAAILKQVQEQVLASQNFDPKASQRMFTICHSDVGSYVLWPRIVQAVNERAPGVRLSLRILAQTDIAAALESAAIDVAIGAFPGLPESLFQRKLFDRQYVALVSNLHPLAGRKLTAQAFVRTPQVVVRQSSGIQEAIDQTLTHLHLQRSLILEMPSYLMLPPLLRSGRHLAVLPGQLADAFSHEGAFSSLKLPFELPSSTIRLHWHRRLHEDAGNVWLRGLIAELFKR